jgi:hypothetical protein
VSKGRRFLAIHTLENNCHQPGGDLVVRQVSSGVGRYEVFDFSRRQGVAVSFLPD